uniref:retention module-containing protein n=1 Tax=Seleniivibrio woodruffii TaxID=1078050 RepID=UPI0026EBAFB1
MAAVGKVVQVIGQAVLHGIDGSVKSIYPGDLISIGDVIETMSGSKVILQLANGREITIGANEQLAIDDSLIASFDDLAMDAEDLQNALENGEQLSDEEEETAAGEETGQGIVLNDILEGDTSEGYVGSYLLPSGNITDSTDTDTYSSSGNNNNDTTATEETGSPVYSIAEGETVPPGFVLNPDGSYYIDPTLPDYDYLGDGESVSYDIDIVITYPNGTTENDTLNVVVAGTNDAPVAYAEIISAVEDGTVVTGQLTATDPDVNDTLTFAIDSASVPEGFTLNEDGTYTFDPSSYDYLAEGEQTVLTIDYTVTDSAGEISYESITITVTGVNDAPVVSDISFSATEDTSVTISAATLLAQATDIDGDNLSIAGITSVTGGTLVDNGNGTYTFTPDKDFNGEATFEFSVTDGIETVSATAKIDVAAVNDAPVAADAIVETTEDTVLTGTLPVASDIDADSVTYALDGDAAHGAVVINSDGTYTYTPAENYNGEDSFSYTVSDGKGGTNTYNIYVSVAPANDAPTAADTTIATDEDTVVTGTLPAAADIDGDDVTYSLDTDAAHGTVTVNADGTYTYTPADNYNGDDSFSYTVSDGKGGTNTYNVAISVGAVNDAAVLGSDVKDLTEGNDVLTTGGLLSISDVDSAVEFVAQTDTQGTYGKFSIGTDGAWTYATDTNMNSLADGETVTETFTVRSADGTETTVTVNITGTNDAATVSSDTVNLTESDTILTTGGVLSITDVDSAAEFVAQTDTQGAYGKFSIGTDGTWTYATDTNMNSLADGETVTETFTVRSADGTETTVTVNITGTNDAAVVSSDVKDLTEGNDVLTTGGLLSISDVDSAAEFVAQTDTQGSYGKFSIGTDGAWTYATDTNMNSLAEGETVTETFTVRSADGTETT